MKKPVKSAVKKTTRKTTKKTKPAKPNATKSKAVSKQARKAGSKQASKTSEKKYRNLIENINDIIYEIDAQGVLLYVSPPVKNISGYDPAELIGKNFIELVHEDDRDLIMKRFTDVVKGIEGPFEYRFRIKSGESIWVWTKTNPIMKDGVFMGGRGLLVDINARKIAEDALRESHINLENKVQERTRELEEINKKLKDEIAERKRTEEAILERSRDLVESQRLADLGTYALDISSGIFKTSEVMDELFGIDDAYDHSIEGWAAIIHHDDREMMLEYLLNEVIVRRQPCDKEFRIVRFNDNATRWLHALGKLEYDANGNPIKLYGTSQDITERKLADDARREVESRFRAFVEQAPMAIGVFRLDGIGLQANKKFAELLGLQNIEEIVGRPAHTYFAPQFREQSKERTQRRLQGLPVPNEYESVALRADGSEFPMHMTVAPVQLAGEKVSIAFMKDISERKQAEMTLRASEEKYHNLYRNASIGIFHSTFEGRFLDVNPALAKMLGYDTPEEVVSSITNIAEQVYAEPETRDAVKADILKAGGLISTENRYRRKDGTFWYGRMHIRIVNDPQGKPNHFEGFIEDITEQKQAEEEKSKTEARYHTLFSRASDGIFMMTTEGKLLEVNESFALMHGYSVEEMLQMNLNDFNTPQSAQMVPDRMNRILAGESLTFEVEHYHKDGHVFSLEVSASMVFSGEVSYVQCFHRDITERKLAKQKLIKSEALFRAVVENSHDGIVLMNADRRPIYVSPSYTQISGYSPEEWIGKYGPDFIHPDDREITAKAFSNVLQSPDKVVTATYRLRHKMGHWFWVETTVTNLLHDPDIQAVVLNSRDITERKRVEAADQANRDRANLQRTAIARLAFEDTSAFGDVTTALRRLTEECTAAIQIERASVWLFSEGDESLQCYSLHEAGTKAHSEGAILKASDYPSYFEAIRNESRIAASEARTDPRTKEFTAGYLTPLGITSMLDAGIRLEGKLVGVVCFEHVGEKRKWHADEEAFASTAAALVSQILTHEVRKQAEVTLRESEAKFRILFETSRDFLYRTAIDGKIIDVNAAASKTSGYSIDELKKMNMMELYFDSGEREALVKKIMEQGFVENYEIKGRRKDGTIVETLVTSIIIKDSDGNPIGFQGGLKDITERKQMEDALKLSEINLRMILDSVDNAIFIYTQTGKIIDVNSKMLEMYGVSRAEVYSMSIEKDFSTPENPLYELPGMWESVIKGEERLFEWQARRPNDGSKFNVEVFLRKINLNNGDFILASVRDITERKQAEAEKANLEKQLFQSQKMEAIGTLAGGIAHDFNNILSVIIGYTELARDRNQKESKEKYLQEILKGAERARNLVKQILTFSRQDDPTEKKPLDIKILLKEAIKFLRSSIPTTVEIKQQLTEEDCNVVADPTQMHQVIMNLCTNASHAMKETGGTLKIELANIELTKDDIPNYPNLQPGHYVKLTVSDTGYGIDPAIVHRVFEPFFTTKSVDEGTGLGLSVVYGIVKGHGGVINVYSEQGKGAAFHVYLPRIIQTEAAKADTDKPVIGGTERILFVDDEPSLVDIGMRILSPLGYHVTGVTSSIETLDIFRADPQRFDLVITDMTLPKMTGVDLSQKLLQIRPDIPIILCSGIKEPETEAQAKSLGIKAYLTKPLTKRELAQAIRNAMDEHKKHIL